MSIINGFPTTLVNGTLEDANQVMTLFNWIQSQVNGNACPATVGSTVLKGDGLGGTTAAIPNVDYVSGSQGQGPIAWAGTSGGTANAQTLTPAVPITALVAGQSLEFIAGFTNTLSAVTFAVSGMTATACGKNQSGGPVALAIGDIVINNRYRITYDGALYFIENVRARSQGAAIASAATINLDTATGDYLQVTGTTSITAVTLAQGEERTLQFASSLTFTNSASLILQSGQNIQTVAGDCCILRGEASGVVRCIGYFPANITPGPFRNELAGFILSPVTTTSMPVGAGQCADSTNSVLINLTAAITKTTGTWAVGTAAGGNDSASGIAASTWYHFYAIRRPDTGVVDVCFTTSATSGPTFTNVPAAYTQFRRIGSGLTNGSSQWVAFVQDGDYYRWLVTAQDVAATNPGTSAVTPTLTVPPGLNVQAFGVLSLADNVTNTSAFVSDIAATDTASFPSINATVITETIAIRTAVPWQLRTDTNGKIRYRLSASGASTIFNLNTFGWYDTKGRFN